MPLGVRRNDIYVLQLEQELRLCLQREDAKTAFLNEWGKVVPAIIRYCEKSNKKTLLEYAKEIDHTGTCIHIVKLCVILIVTIQMMKHCKFLL